MNRPLVTVAIGAGLVAIVAAPSVAPVPILVAAVGAGSPLARAWRAARGTALRPTVVWAAIAIGLVGVAQAVALGEATATGRPASGQVVYLATLAGFATLISVLNARSPGGGAWAILMGLLGIVFLVPWLEGSGLVRQPDGWDRLRLRPPWTIFYGLIVLAGVTNFLPTRVGRAAAVAGLGFGLEYLGLTRLDLSRTTRSGLFEGSGLALTAVAWLADRESDRPRPPGSEFDRLWLWFRDGWGVVWALRTADRFNRTAALARWPFRLAWEGAVSAGPATGIPIDVPPEAVKTLAGLLRRFAEPGRIEAVQALN